MLSVAAVYDRRAKLQDRLLWFSALTERRYSAVVIGHFAHKFVITLTRSLSILKVAFVCLCTISVARAQQVPAPTPSIVFKARDTDAVREYKTNPAVVRSMVNRLVLAVTGKSDIAEAWRSLVGPKDKIGIKISAAGGELFTTHHDVVEAIVDGLVAAGHPRDTIVVWDRSIAGAKEAVTPKRMAIN